MRKILENQLHLRNSIDPLDFSKFESLFLEPDVLGDREGGFWTSSFNKEFGCEWLHYKIYKPWANVYNGYLFEVKADTNIFYIDSPIKEDIFMKDFKGNYNLLAQRYDCIHLPRDYVEHLRNTRSSSHFLHWTCDCTWWFNVEKLILVDEFNGEEIMKFASVPYKDFLK